MASHRVVVHGKVQGVGYRAFAHATAAELGLKATAENLSDGTVVVSVEGEHAALVVLLERLRVGPPHAIVERIDVTGETEVGVPGGDNQ